MPYATARDPWQDKSRTGLFLGAFTLSFLAGDINVTMLSQYAIPVSHMTGAVSRFGMNIGQGQWADLIPAAMIIISFLSGCMFTGCILGHAQFQPRRRYAFVLACETLLLAVAALVVKGESRWAVALCSCACGLQNALASSYYGLVVRTTHVTGIVTDLGFMLGAMLSGRRFDRWKYALLGILLTGFIAGAAISAVTIRILQDAALWTCCILAGALAVGCHALHRRNP
jgi:uncharacterized membrane protein YoaK (UPF0700 family)